MTASLLTVGHGTLEREELAELLRGAGIERLVDVRRFPGSRTNDAAARGAVQEVCEEAGIEELRGDLARARTAPRCSI